MSDDELIAELEWVGRRGVSLDAEAAARIRALIAGRDEARRDRVNLLALVKWAEQRAEKAEAEADRLRGLLREAKDAIELMLDHDARWVTASATGRTALARVAAALATEETP